MKISRDIFWEDSMHGYYQENVGVNPKVLINEQDFQNIQRRQHCFYVYREDETSYFEPIRVEVITQRKTKQQPIARMNQTNKTTRRGSKEHRSYHFQDLTTGGTIEYRSVCTQPLIKT